jgi:hypothetical protein
MTQTQPGYSQRGSSDSGVWVPPWIWEAIVSIKASHAEGCDCVVCRAAAGSAGAAETVIRAYLGGSTNAFG